LKFSCDNKILSNAIQTSTLKGKYYTSGGLKNKFLSEYLYLVCKGNTLTIHNADETLCLTLNITVEGIEDGSATIEGNTLITYLKKFSDITTLEFKDYLSIRGAGKTAKMALVVNHPHMNMINNFNQHESEFNVMTPIDLVKSWGGKTPFSTRINLDSQTLVDAVDSCEIVGTGIYKFDYGEDFTVSSDEDFKGFKTVVEGITGEGEEATVEFTAPVHKFFNNAGTVDILFSDDSLILMLAIDRKLVKAPFVRLR